MTSSRQEILLFLWRRRWAILLGTVIVAVYALPLDALAVARGWGDFNPAYVSGVILVSTVPVDTPLPPLRGLLLLPHPAYANR